MSDTSHRSVDGLVGEQLSAVAFVQDYVELHFDGPVIRALTNPIIHSNGAQVAFPAPGSRDALCQFIGRLVAKVELAETVSLTCHFQGGGSVIVPLDPDSYRGAEADAFSGVAHRHTSGVELMAACGHLTPRWSGRVEDKVPSPYAGVRAAQLNR